MTIARLVLLISVLLMPLGMTPAAAITGGHHMSAAMAVSHCDGQRSKPHPTGGLAECTMGCAAALPALAAPPAQAPLPIAGTLIRPSAGAVLHGLHPDPATPPPRLS